MSLRGKLIIAQAPLAVALAAVGVFSAMVTTRLGEQSHDTAIIRPSARYVGPPAPQPVPPA